MVRGATAISALWKQAYAQQQALVWQHWDLGCNKVQMTGAADLAIWNKNKDYTLNIDVYKCGYLLELYDAIYT